MILFTISTEKLNNKNSKIEELLAKISNGDTKSMGILYDIIATDVFAFALSKTANKHDADDVMQDTFLNIYKYAKQYQPQGKPLAWVFRIELNLIRRQIQLKSRTIFLEEELNNTPSKENFEEDIISNTFIKEILKDLNEDEREIITLHIISGMKHREISQLLQKPLSTILSKYNRAIKKLKLIVKEGH